MIAGVWCIHLDPEECEVDMKFAKGVCCLLVASVAWYVSELSMGFVPESWLEVLSSLLTPWALLGCVWLLVFLPLLFFSRRLETCGWLKARTIACALGGLLALTIYLVLRWMIYEYGGVSGRWGWVVYVQLGICTGLMFALGAESSGRAISVGWCSGFWPSAAS
jgi:hypothetical protein